MFNIFKKDVEGSNVGIFEGTDNKIFDAFQKLQIYIDLVNAEKPIQTISVTSANKGESKSTTLCNLANVYALKGHKVCILDLDLRRPNIHKIFVLPNKQGIIQVVTEGLELEKVINHCGKIDVITSGGTTPFPSNIINSEVLHNHIKKLEESYEYVLIDSSPALISPDAIYIGKMVDAILLIARVDKSYKKDIKECAKLLKENNIPVIGTVLTGYKHNSSDYGSYYRSYYSTSEKK